MLLQRRLPFLGHDLERLVPGDGREVAGLVELAVAVVLTGFVLGLALACIRAYGIRAVNALIVVFVDIFHTDRAGLAGVLLVVAAGLVGMLLVRVDGPPARTSTA